MQEYSPIEWLEKFYHHLLMYSKEGNEAKEYLKKRGIKEETMKKFKLGFSPKNEQITLEFLKTKGFDLQALVIEKVITRYQSGKRKGQMGDLFSGRITIPITDFNGEVVAFGGRSLKKDARIKYINSPSSNRYAKGENLFGFSYAEKHIKDKGFVILVEGYFDFLQAYQAGIKNVVAVLGVALTPSQALLLKSVTNKAVVVFDSDSAGKEASLNIAKMLIRVGFNVTIANTKEENDPDDYIRKNGIDVFVNLIKDSSQYIDRLINYYSAIYNNLQTPVDRLLFVQKVLEEIPENRISERKKVLKKLSIALGDSLISLYGELVKRGF